PSMLVRGEGWLLNTASAAGLLTSPGDAPYTVTKHGAVALAEWLAVTYGDQGIGVSVLCPMGVATPLLMDPLAAGDLHVSSSRVRRAGRGSVGRPA
ncbi:MAG: SDR family NAD(P)-dependent oxidoreductase, partial [Jatrophihabitans sp.]|uniref:SDR family NAD(P)-dependent oxidoreductase n=1 Tax=Jatrophihabitans sp. TaxID=1932789 RepID=UPI003916B0D8